MADTTTKRKQNSAGEAPDSKKSKVRIMIASILVAVV
jgi:hypothetical protein